MEVHQPSIVEVHVVFLSPLENLVLMSVIFFFDHLRIQSFHVHPILSSFARNMSFAQSLAKKADEVEAKRKEDEKRRDAEEAVRIRDWVFWAAHRRRYCFVR